MAHPKMQSLREAAPAPHGWRMPAEWEPHEATWLSWPHKRESWPGNFEPIPIKYCEIVRALTPHEIVRINVSDDAMAAEVESLLRAHNAWSDRVELWRIPTNDAWARDHGPCFLVREGKGTEREIGIIDWRFNMWGDKYPPYDLDDVVPTRIAAKMTGVPLWQPDFVLEGGSIEVNGAGIVLTTEACLLNPNRNPGYSREEIEEVLKLYLNGHTVLWLGDGIVGDDTDGHIDDLTRFTDPNTLVTVVEEDPADENFALLRENLERLKTMKNERGVPFRVIELPMPEPVMFDGHRLPASYANFYIANGVVLVPTFQCAADRKAITTLQEAFPGRRIVGIDCRELVWGLGALHCISQQQPARHA